jgi:tetratricopeptide (TPR) repeat protein
MGAAAGFDRHPMNARLKTAERTLAPQLEKQRQRRRRVVAVAACIFVVLAVAMFQIKPVLLEVSKWRSRRYAAKAEVDMSAENWQGAQVKAQIAYQLRPDEPAAIRAVARLQSLSGNAAGANQFWDLLKKANALTTADRRMRAEDLLRAGSQPEARQEVESLLGEAPNDPSNLRLAAKWAASEKNYDQAMDFASRAQRMDPGNDQGTLLLGLLQCESPRVGARQTGIQTLLKLADDRGKQGLEALVFLATRKDLPPANAPTVVARLREHPLAAENHRLLALDLDLLVRPAEREAVLDAAMQHYQAADAAAQRAFGVWLNGHREFERTLNLIPVTEAMKRKDFLLVTLDAMAAQKRWTEIEEVLQGRQVPLDEVYTELFLARSAMELGRTTGADLHWRRAHIAAAASVEQMWFLGTYAEKIGQTDHAELAFRSLTNNAATARPAYEGLLRLAEKRRDTGGVRDILGEMIKRWPQDTSVRNDYTYFTLLRNLDLEESLKTARELVAQAPASLAHRTTLALANLRLNDATGAISVYRGTNVPWDRAPASHRAIYAAVLGLNGNISEARAQASAIPIDSLRPEERALIAPWRAP